MNTNNNVCYPLEMSDCNCFMPVHDFMTVVTI